MERSDNHKFHQAEIKPRPYVFRSDTLKDTLSRNVLKGAPRAPCKASSTFSHQAADSAEPWVVTVVLCCRRGQASMGRKMTVLGLETLDVFKKRLRSLKITCS